MTEGRAEILLTSGQMRAAEAEAIASGTPGIELMRRAGEAVVRHVLDRTSPGARILVLCGPGNNGGDGYVVAMRLAEEGRRVQVAALISPDAIRGAAAVTAAAWSGPTWPIEAAEPGDHDLVVDALFGIGLSRGLDGSVAALIGRVNACGRPVVAIDIPSGIEADTGQARGAAIRAAATVTFATRKPGHLLYPGRAHAGMVEVAGIGVPHEVVARPGLHVNVPALWAGALPRPGADGHKYDRGHALVVSGAPAHTGAARLAARGALRAGAGLVSVVTSARALAVNAAHLTAIMMRVCDDPDEFSDLLTDDRFNAIALGPALGIGGATRAWVAAAIEADRATVLDADALTSFSGEVEALRALTSAPRERPVVMTPHEGEMKRLFAGRDEPSAEARSVMDHASKLDRARAAASFMGCVLVLKGADTVIAAPDGRAAINENGSPWLATAGSGDVLGGIVTGLLAQGMPGFEAACAAVWMHAEAGSRFGPGLIAEDLPETLPQVLRDLL